MSIEEFRDHLFDIINETNEILVRDVKVDEEMGNIEVTVLDGSAFVVNCEKR